MFLKVRINDVDDIVVVMCVVRVELQLSQLLKLFLVSNRATLIGCCGYVSDYVSCLKIGSRTSSIPSSNAPTASTDLHFYLIPL